MVRRRNEPIATWEDGDSVSGFALVTRKEKRQDRNGKSFLDMELTDASGMISAKAWADSAALSADFAAHDFIAFKGSVKEYRGQLQVSVHDCRRAREADREHGFDEGMLVPSTPEDIDDLWERLEGILRERPTHPLLRRLAVETLEVHGQALREHPAAKLIHHAYRGGLLEHVTMMAELAVHVAERYPELDGDLLLLGVLFHDLGKLEELGAMPVNDYTTPGRLIGHVVLGRDLLRERIAAIEDFPADLQLRLEHLVLSHQGRLEYGSPVEPMTPEAFALHFIDDLDSKLAQLREASRRGTGLQYIRGFRRHLLLEAPGGDQDASEEEKKEESSESQLTL